MMEKELFRQAIQRIIELNSENIAVLKEVLDHSSLPPTSVDRGPLMTRQQVKDFLGISERTYIRKVNEGILKPIKMPGGDRFYKFDLLDAFNESVRRGRI